jgi:hypothetical protein
LGRAEVPHLHTKVFAVGTPEGPDETSVVEFRVKLSLQIEDAPIILHPPIEGFDGFPEQCERLKSPCDDPREINRTTRRRSGRCDAIGSVQSTKLPRKAVLGIQDRIESNRMHKQIRANARRSVKL